MSGRKTVRDRWYAQVVKTKAINGACRLLLMHVAACHMDETGRIGHMDETTGRFRGVRRAEAASATAVRLQFRARRVGGPQAQEHAGRRGDGLPLRACRSCSRRC